MLSAAKKILVTQAFGSWSPNVPNKMVGVYATNPDGEIGGDIKETRWLVPEKEYLARGSNPFEIDTVRHIQLDNSVEFGEAAVESALAWRQAIEAMTKMVVMCVSVDNGDAAVFLNGNLVYSIEADEESPHSAYSIALPIASALGVEVVEKVVATPSDPDWNWDDIYGLVAG